MVLIKDKILPSRTTEGYFTKRARKYNHSSHWVNDALLIKKIRNLANVSSKAYVLDIGTGTGKIAEAFQGKVKYVVGLDICAEMIKQAKGRMDEIVLAQAEKLPFKNEVFDLCVCRQGLQFMNSDKVLSQIYRVLKPNGTVVLCHLVAYGKEDKDETFLIQKFRNPARKNFFLADDFTRLLQDNAFREVEVFDYLTRESVNQWIESSAISQDAKVKIRKVYKNSSAAFKSIHQIQFKDADVFDTMKMLIIKAIKKPD